MSPTVETVQGESWVSKSPFATSLVVDVGNGHAPLVVADVVTTPAPVVVTEVADVVRTLLLAETFVVVLAGLEVVVAEVVLVDTGDEEVAGGVAAQELTERGLINPLGYSG